MSSPLKNVVDYAEWSLVPFTKLMTTGGTDGFAFDAGDISTLNQVSTGTTPVTAVADPIGLMLDKHLGLQLGPELWPSPTFDSSAGITMDAGMSIAGGKLVWAIAAASGSTRASVSVIGKLYKVTYTIESISADGVRVISAPNTGIARNSPGTYTEYIVAGGTSIGLQSFGSATATIDNLSVKLLDGNHALQATAAARPSWQVDANGRYYAQFLGTDDSLSSATGGGGSTGFLFCASLKPTGGAGTSRYIFDDKGVLTGYRVNINTANVLAFGANNGATETVLASTATVDVGTTNYFTAWDDGTNLNVQVGGGSVQSVARPVVAAGTAGFTLGKSNSAAANYLIADFYRAVYIKNWSGTAAQLAAIQSWVKAGAGL